MEITNNFLIRLKAYSTDEVHVWYCNSDQDAMVREFTGSGDGGESSTIILLK